MEAIAFANWILENYNVITVSSPERIEYNKWIKPSGGPSFTTEELYKKWKEKH